MRNKIVLVVGPSGSGKSSIVDAMEKLYSLKSIESYTTRAPRYEGEKGHIFVSEEEFKALPAMCAYTYFNGNHYGVTSDIVDKSDLYVIDTAGVEYFKEHYNGFKEAVVVFIDVPADVCFERMLARGDSDEAARARIEHDEAAFAGAKAMADIVVVNDRDANIVDIACEVFNKVGFVPVKERTGERENFTQTELRIIGALKNIDKTEKTMERHRKTLMKKRQKCLDLGFDPEAENADDRVRELSSGSNHDAYWAYCEYSDTKEAIKSNVKKITELTEKLGEYREKKAFEDKKNAVPIVPSVEEFLAGWKENAATWMREQVIALNKFKDEIAVTKKAIESKYEPRPWEHRKEIAAEEKEARVDYQTVNKRISMNFSADIRDMYNYRGVEFEERLEKVLTDEVRRKRIDLFTRCSAAVGVITDATHLYVGDDLNLNGYVVGEKGKANVHTIGAGGYNIQCFHYRVLVQPVREKACLDDVISAASTQSGRQKKEVSCDKNKDFLDR